MVRLPNLPEEVMADIFCRLPAKSVGRCRCLSKPWRALLSQPHFTKTHLNQSIDRRENSLLLIAEDHNYLCSAPFNDARQLFDEITIPAKRLSFAAHSDPWFKVYASCNGLVLAIDFDEKTFVLNPITREIRQVSDSPFLLSPEGTREMHGFGYDSVNDDYMVVTLSRYDTESGFGYTTDDEDDSDYCPQIASVYSMKSNTWEKVEISPYYCHRLASGVFLNGGIHWGGEVEISEDSFEFVVVVFDVAEKKFKKMQSPNSFDLQMAYNSPILGVLDGCLCVYTDRGSVVWVMKEYGVQESWTSFTINDLKVRFNEFRVDDFLVLCMLRKEEIVLSTDYGEKTVLYNLKRGTFKDVVFHGVPDNLIVHKSFVESLISPHTLH